MSAAFTRAGENGRLTLAVPAKGRMAEPSLRLVPCPERDDRVRQVGQPRDRLDRLADRALREDSWRHEETC